MVVRAIARAFWARSPAASFLEKSCWLIKATFTVFPIKISRKLVVLEKISEIISAGLEWRSRMADIFCGLRRVRVAAFSRRSSIVSNSVPRLAFSRRPAYFETERPAAAAPLLTSLTMAFGRCIVILSILKCLPSHGVLRFHGSLVICRVCIYYIFGYG